MNPQSFHTTPSSAATHQGVLAGTEHELSSRERLILQAIVHNFILDATPVGSRNLSKYLQQDLKLSPASIRNAMADLEELGYIAQPHTSAGRVPTDKGYRYYVDSLMNVEPLHPNELGSIASNIRAAQQEVLRQSGRADNPAISRDISRILGSLSHYLSIVRIPQVTRSVVEKIELFPLVTNRLLVVLTLSSEVVRTLSLELHFALEPDHAFAAQQLLNERLCGKSVDFIRDNLAEVVKDADIDSHALLRLFVEQAEQLFSADAQSSGTETRGETLHIAGAQHLFDYPEFGSTTSVRSIIELIESEEVVVHLLDHAAPEEGLVRVVIGQEMNSSLMEEYSLLTTKYRYTNADVAGTIGLIGPKRMNYARMIGIIQHVALVLSQHE